MTELWDGLLDRDRVNNPALSSGVCEKIFVNEMGELSNRYRVAARVNKSRGQET